MRAIDAIVQWVAVPAPQTFGSALKKLVVLQLHATFANTLFYLLQAITVASVGSHLSSDELAGFSLALFICVYICMSVLFGTATALDTLISQAYGHDSHSPEIPIAFLRGLLTTTVIMIPVIVFFLVSEPLMILFAGDRVGKIAAHVLRWAAPFNVAQMFSTLFQRSLIAQRLANVVLLANFTALVVCAIANYFMTPLGVEYAILALAVGIAAAVIVMASGALLHPKSAFRNAEWPSLTDVFDWKELKHFAWLALVGLVALVGERWAFLSLMVLASSLPPPTLAALGIYLNIITVASPLGTGQASGTMCGNSVGAGDVALARSYLRLGLLDTSVLTAVVATCLYTMAVPIFKLYVQDTAVIELMEQCKAALILFHIGDAFRTVLYFVFRGFGQNAVAPVIVIVSLWMVGVPAAWYLSFHMKVPLRGILLGFSIGFALELFLLFRDMNSRWDWETIREAATTVHSKHHRNAKDSEPSRDESQPLL